MFQQTYGSWNQNDSLAILNIYLVLVLLQSPAFSTYSHRFHIFCARLCIWCGKRSAMLYVIESIRSRIIFICRLLYVISIGAQFLFRRRSSRQSDEKFDLFYYIFIFGITYRVKIVFAGGCRWEQIRIGKRQLKCFLQHQSNQYSFVFHGKGKPFSTWKHQ